MLRTIICFLEFTQVGRMFSISSSSVFNWMVVAAMLVVVLMSNWTWVNLKFIQVKVFHSFNSLHWRIHCFKDLICSVISLHSRIVKGINFMDLWITKMLSCIAHIVGIRPVVRLLMTRLLLVFTGYKCLRVYIVAGRLTRIKIIAVHLLGLVI